MEAPLQSQPVERLYMRLVVSRLSPIDAPGAGAAPPPPGAQLKKRKKAQKPDPHAPAAEQDKTYVLDPLTIFYIHRN